MRHAPVLTKPRLTLSRILIGVCTVFLTLLILLFVFFGVANLRDALHSEAIYTEENYTNALLSEDYSSLTNMATSDMSAYLKKSNRIMQLRAVGLYHEAAALYKAFAATDDSIRAKEQAERMESYASQAPDFQDEIQKINTTLGL